MTQETRTKLWATVSLPSPLTTLRIMKCCSRERCCVRADILSVVAPVQQTSSSAYTTCWLLVRLVALAFLFESLFSFRVRTIAESMHRSKLRNMFALTFATTSTTQTGPSATNHMLEGSSSWRSEHQLCTCNSDNMSCSPRQRSIDTAGWRIVQRDRHC